MALTDHSDLFSSVHEDGINIVVRHIMLQRPSLFNYATAFFVEHRDLLCAPIEAAPAVEKAKNPLFTVQDPIPVLGTPRPIGLNWCLQFTDLQIDFHPSNAIALPAELGTLEPQRLAIRLKACFGLDCPPDELINEVLSRIEAQAATEGIDGIRDGEGTAGDEQIETWVLATRELICFCLELFVVAHFEWGTIAGIPDKQWLKVRLDGLEIVDLQPTPMENLIECYARTTLRLGILPRLSMPIEKLVLNITELLQKEGIKIGTKITLQPAPVPASVPNNPAIEDHQLKVFIDLIEEEA